MFVYSIVGARPQFIKAAAVSRALHEAGHREFLLHTGQHYDAGMSQVFFEELDIPEPCLNLNLGSAGHAGQMARMLAGIEDALSEERPDWVILYGDTNSTAAAALAVAKLQLPIAHVEAGLRSFNRSMPEEMNRIVADRLSDILFCPSQTAVDNLAAEGICEGVHLVGDVMADSLAFGVARARKRSQILSRLGLCKHEYLIATVHTAPRIRTIRRDWRASSRPSGVWNRRSSSPSILERGRCCRVAGSLTFIPELCRSNLSAISIHSGSSRAPGWF